MLKQEVTTEQFGAMRLNCAADAYETVVNLPYLKSNVISISAEGFATGVQRMHAFVAWLNENHQLFKLPLEQAIQDYDLVWDDVWSSLLGEGWLEAEEGFLAEYIHFVSLDFNHGKIHLWIDTSGLHTDHLVRVTVDEAMQIDLCEML